MTETKNLFLKTSTLSSKPDKASQMSDETREGEVSLELSDFSPTKTTSSLSFLYFEAKNKMLAKLGLRGSCCTSQPH